MTLCEKIQDNLAAEVLEASAELSTHLESCPDCRAEAEAFRRLAAALQGLEAPDPGELFFAAQRKRIHETLSAEVPARRFFWRPALALAAAVVLLFIGVSRWQGGEDSPVSAWSTALLGLVEGQSSVTAAGILELESLDPEQLDRLARNMERRILGDSRDELLEEGPDLQDLSGSELDQLIQRLKFGEKA